MNPIPQPSPVVAPDAPAHAGKTSGTANDPQGSAGACAPLPPYKRLCLVNRTAARAFALEVSRQTGRPFTRVSDAFIADLEYSLRTMIAGRVHRARSGATLKL